MIAVETLSRKFRGGLHDLAELVVRERANAPQSVLCHLLQLIGQPIEG